MKVKRRAKPIVAVPCPVEEKTNGRAIGGILFPSSGNKPDKSKAVCVYITPKLAKVWLERNTENRPMSAGTTQKLEATLLADAWRINGETIKFSTNGTLLDGQTRLAAIVNTGKSAWCWVIYDLDPNCFPSIDQGRSRNLGHLLSIRGCLNYAALANMIRLLYSLDPTIPDAPGGFTTRIGLTILDERPELTEHLAWMVHNDIRATYSIGSAATLYYLMARCNAEKARDYWEQIASGTIAAKHSPVRIVRDILIRNQAAKADNKLTAVTLRAIIIKGWNLYSSGQHRKYIRWDSERETFPVIEG